MTDRIQQMLDSVRDELGASPRKPRGWKVRSILRARAKQEEDTEALEAILRKPNLTNELDGIAKAKGDVDVSYFGPSHPDEWKSPDLIASARAAQVNKNGPKIDPAEAAMATFQAARLEPVRRSGRFGLKAGGARDDHPARSEQQRSRQPMGDERTEAPAAPLRRRKGGGIERVGRDPEIVIPAARAQKLEIVPPKRRGSWLKALKRR